MEKNMKSKPVPTFLNLCSHSPEVTTVYILSSILRKIPHENINIFVLFLLWKFNILLLSLSMQSEECFKKISLALAGVAQWIECGLQTKGSPVPLPVRAHAWIVGQVPSVGHARGNHTLIFLSLFLLLFSSL